MVGETSQLNLNNNENDKTSSVRVRPGCILSLFKHINKVELLYSLTTDVSLLGHNDQVSSLSCACQGMKKSFFLELLTLKTVGGYSQLYLCDGT